MEPTPKPAQPDASSSGSPGTSSDPSVTDDQWSPFSTRAARWSWGLLAIFAAIYFVVAILTSSEFAELAATMIFGLPLGFILGMVLIIAGLIITRVYLIKVEA